MHLRTILPLSLLGLATITSGCAVEQQSAESDTATVEQAFASAPPAKVGVVEVQLEGRGDAADIYYPIVKDSDDKVDEYPVIVHLQGGNTDKQYYQEFAARVARQGFVVIVPTHSVVFGPPGTPPSILPDQTLVLEGLATAKALDADPESPLYQITDTSKLGLTGHSVGGIVGLWSIEGRCQAPFCFGYFPKPAELMAGVFFGTNSIGPTGVVDDIETGDTPVALIQGGADGRASVERGLATYDILDGPRAYIELAGLTHYGINDVALPEGATPDPNESAFPQHVANRMVADWTALALRSYMKDDALSSMVLYHVAPRLNGLVTAYTEE